MAHVTKISTSGGLDARRAHRRDQPGGSSTQTLRDRAFFWMTIILAGWLLFAHGCHGDEDNELFTSALRVLRVE